MKVFYSDHFVLPLPEGHRFPMIKYSMLRESVAASGICGPEEMMVPHPVSDAEILRSHEEGYLRRVASGTLTEKRCAALALPVVPENGRALEKGLGRHSGSVPGRARRRLRGEPGRGTHHAFADRGEGYCVFNDSAIAARAVQAEGLVERVVVVDTDVHQGNGTAAIVRGDATIYTLSIHGVKNFLSARRRATSTSPSPTARTTVSSSTRSKKGWSAPSKSRGRSWRFTSPAPTL